MEVIERRADSWRHLCAYWLRLKAMRYLRHCRISYVKGWTCKKGSLEKDVHPRKELRWAVQNQLLSLLQHFQWQENLLSWWTVSFKNELASTPLNNLLMTLKCVGSFVIPGFCTPYWFHLRVRASRSYGGQLVAWFEVTRAFLLYVILLCSLPNFRTPRGRS